ncbi:ParB/RepB/Spo0J family partition protein [Labrys sp. KB_33_2]|uniref:ParB/RepB/Spo0J family partition protein n=1 Tax=Labrys sp. KB_33_2 TaxID=3237479 RepID=UPI003F8F14E3
MAAATQKITLSSSRDIPFNKLVLSQANVRRVKAGVSIEELAESIARRGLIQSLHVRPVVDAEGGETGLYEVPAGGRRYRALELLAKQKRFGKSALVPCVVSSANSDVMIDEVSLAENIERAPLHPLDQFRAFHAMREKGMSEEEIAGAFFISVNIVKQRLKLCTVSPALLDVYADDGMTIAQLEAFSVTDDHDRQEQIWEQLKNAWSKEPYQIRRMLTDDAVRASDKRAVFVGIEAYQAAGGSMLRDLFQSDGGGWLQDVALLDRLVAEKLRTRAEEIAEEGWKWIDIAATFAYGASHGMRELEGMPVDMSEDERATLEALRAEFDRLQADHEDSDELPDDVDQRLGEIETALEALQARPMRFDPAEIARAGVFVSIGGDGSLLVERGFVKPDDEAPTALEEDTGGVAAGCDGNVDVARIRRAVITIDGEPPEAEEDENDGLKPLPDRLIMELTANRTLALRDKLATQPAIAFLAVLHKFCQDIFFAGRQYGFAMEVTVRGTTFQAQPEGLRDCDYAKAIEARHDAWQKRLPEKVDDLWDTLAALTGAEQADLFAHCASFGVNALYDRADRHGGGRISSHGIEQRLAEADRLSKVVGLDMTQAGWRPTVANYLGRVTKARILEAVREGEGERAAELIGHLKKGDMAKEAERLLADSGWLPEPLRLTDLDIEEGAPDADGEYEAIPAFLADDDEDALTEDGEGQPRVAAE